MSQPAYYLEGTTPLKQDTKLRIWTKILGYYQNLPGANPVYDPHPADGLRRIIEKILKVKQ